MGQVFSKTKLIFLAAFLVSIQSGCSLFSNDEQPAKVSEIVVSNITAPTTSAEAVAGADSNNTSGNHNNKKNEDSSFIGKLSESFKSGAGYLSDSVKDIADTTMTVVGLRQNKTEEKSAKALSIEFDSIGWGEIPSGQMNEFEKKHVALITNFEELLNFRSKVSMLNSAPVGRSFESIDFEEETVMVVFSHYNGSKIFSNVSDVTHMGEVEIVVNVGKEDSECEEFVRSGRKGISFQVIVLKQKGTMSDDLPVTISKASEHVVCSRYFGNYASFNLGQKIPFEIVDELSAEYTNSTDVLTVELFKNKWGRWSSFKANYCPECSKHENEIGFPKNRLLVALRSGFSTKNEEIFLKEISYVGGFVYLDVRKKQVCGLNTKKQKTILISLDRKVFLQSFSNLSLDRFVLPGPFLPAERVSCPKL